MERLELLEKEEKAWVHRDNWAHFDRAKFERDVKAERSRQELDQRTKEQTRQRIEEVRCRYRKRCPGLGLRSGSVIR